MDKSMTTETYTRDSDKELDLDSYAEGVLDGKEKGWSDAVDIFFEECMKFAKGNGKINITRDDLQQIAKKMRGES